MMISFFDVLWPIQGQMHAPFLELEAWRAADSLSDVYIWLNADSTDPFTWIA